MKDIWLGCERWLWTTALVDQAWHADMLFFGPLLPLLAETCPRVISASPACQRLSAPKGWRQCRCRLVRIYLSVFTPYPVPKARNPLFAMPAVSIHVHVFISLHLWNDSASYARDWASSHAFLSHPMTVCKKDSPFRGKIDGTDHLRSREPFKCLPTLSFKEHTPSALVSIIVKYYTYIYI